MRRRRRRGKSEISHGLAILASLRESKLTQYRAMGFYFMIDLLRSLYLTSATSFQAHNISIPLSNGVSLQTIFEDFIIYSMPLEEELSADDYLLILLVILSEVVAVQRSLGPLSDPVPEEGNDATIRRILYGGFAAPINDAASLSDRQQGQTRSFRQAAASQRAGEASDPFTGYDSVHALMTHFVYINPHLSCSATAEYTRILKLLESALHRWISHCLGHKDGRLHVRTAPSHEDDSHLPAETIAFVDPNCMPLVYFCKLILIGGPCLLSLPSRVGFSAKHNFRVPTSIDKTTLPVISDATLREAWAILDSFDAVNQANARGSGQVSWTPMWSPIICFIAALTLWAHQQGSRANLTAGSKREAPQAGPTSAKMIRLFEMELRDMNWPCAAVMADILADLRFV